MLMTADRNVQSSRSPLAEGKLENGSDLTTCALQLDGVGKDFGGVAAVRQVDLRISKGEFFAILGPSGCGKTTTLRMIAGLEHPDTGRIVSGGQVVTCSQQHIFVPPRKRNMGMVFQSYAMWPHLTVYQTVAYPLRTRRKPASEIDRRVREALALVGLTGYEKRRASSLSGGQQQRVSIARAIVYEPNVLLLDEPFSSLDLKLREQLRVDVKLLQRRLGIAVLLVTHDQVEALTLADRVAVMHDGVIEQIADPRTIYNRPSTEFVRDFVGRSITFPAVVDLVDSDGTVRVQMLGNSIPVGPQNAAKGFVAKERCSASVRPEDLMVTVSRSGEFDNRAVAMVEGTVRTILFTGDRTECVIEAQGYTFETFVDRNATLTENQTVFVGIPHTALQLWARIE